MDIFDKATEQEEMTRAAAIAAAAVPKAVLIANGRCHNCEAYIKLGEFCDADCRDDWQRRNANR